MHAPFLHGPVADVLCSDVPDATSEQHRVPPAAGTRCPGLSTLGLRPPYLARLEPCPAVVRATALPAISNTSKCEGTILCSFSLQNMSYTSDIQLTPPQSKPTSPRKYQVTKLTGTMDTVFHLTLVTDAHFWNWFYLCKQNKVGTYSDSPTDGATVPSHIICSAAISTQAINPTTAFKTFKVSILVLYSFKTGTEMHSGACWLRLENTSHMPNQVHVLHSAFIVSIITK